MENKRKHLEMIQGIINRMAGNSFLLKGWVVTLIVGLFALDVSKTNGELIKISFLPIIVFWLLDGYFLYEERLFRDLYDDVRGKEENLIDFSMKRKKSTIRYFDALFSKTIFLIYGSLSVVVAYVEDMARG